MHICLSVNIKYHYYQSNSPNVTDDSSLVRLLTAAEKTGGMNPEIAREIVGDIMGRELHPVDDQDIPSKVPFSLTVAKEAKNTEGNISGLRTPSLEAVKKSAGLWFVESLIEMRAALESEYDKWIKNNL